MLEAMVSSAADAFYVRLDHAGLTGDAVDDRLTTCRGDRLDVSGWRAEVANDPWPRSPGLLSEEHISDGRTGQCPVHITAVGTVGCTNRAPEPDIESRK